MLKSTFTWNIPQENNGLFQLIATVLIYCVLPISSRYVTTTKAHFFKKYYSASTIVNMSTELIVSLLQVCLRYVTYDNPPGSLVTEARGPRKLNGTQLILYFRLAPLNLVAKLHSAQCRLQHSPGHCSDKRTQLATALILTPYMY